MGGCSAPIVAGIRIVANTHCEALPGYVDNAKALTVKIFMELTLQTKMSTTKPSYGGAGGGG